MIDLAKQFYIKYSEEIRYIVFGFLTTIISWGAKYLASLFLDASIIWQNSLLSAIAWIAGVFTAFLLNRVFVFRSTNSNWFSEFLKMFSGRAGVGFIGIVIQNIFVNYLYINLWISTIVWAILEVIANYFISKFWVFKS